MSTTSQNMKIERKLISFTERPSEINEILQDMEDGWSIVSLMQNGVYFVGVMEKNDTDNKDSIYIPPRKKIKIISTGE